MQRRLSAILCLLTVAALAVIAAFDFREQRIDEPLYPSAALTRTAMLSDYFADLKGTRGDTPIYFFESQVAGGTALIFGGIHPNEPSGYLAAYLLVENLNVERGRIIVIPRANHSAFTHTDPGEASPAHFQIQTPSGPRRFRVGSRISNPLDAWPDPEVYRHFPSGQELSGSETRNLNRSFPGRADGNFTERVAFAITELVKREEVDLVIDLHEASPEYPVINAIIAHERSLELATLANMNLQAAGINFMLEPSPQNFHGLTHRELGDATGTHAILMETANIMQGRLRGSSLAEKVLTGRDEPYTRAAKSNLVRVPYDSTGISIEIRVGRHLSGMSALIFALAFTDPTKTITFSGIPSYDELKGSGIGRWLAPK